MTIDAPISQQNLAVAEASAFLVDALGLVNPSIKMQATPQGTELMLSFAGLNAPDGIVAAFAATGAKLNPPIRMPPRTGMAATVWMFTGEVKDALMAVRAEPEAGSAFSGEIRFFEAKGRTADDPRLTYHILDAALRIRGGGDAELALLCGYLTHRVQAAKGAQRRRVISELLSTLADQLRED